MLTVTHLVTGGWQADIDGPDATRRSPVLGSRGAAQAWPTIAPEMCHDGDPPGRGGAAHQLIIVPAPDLRDVAVSCTCLRASGLAPTGARRRRGGG